MIAGPPTLLWGRARSPHRVTSMQGHYPLLLTWQEASLPWEGVGEVERGGGLRGARDAFKGRKRSTEAVRPQPRACALIICPEHCPGLLGSATWAVTNPPPHGRGWGRRHGPSVGVGGIRCSDEDARLVRELRRPGQFLVCSFCHGPMGPWAHSRRLPGKTSFVIWM